MTILGFAAVGQPAWFTALIIGITTLGTILTGVAALINSYVAFRRLNQIERQHLAHHQELLAAIERQK